MQSRINLNKKWAAVMQWEWGLKSFDIPLSKFNVKRGVYKNTRRERFNKISRNTAPYEKYYRSKKPTVRMKLGSRISVK